VADANRFFDVWILETNAAYRNVPYMVVTDWVQQGRLLLEDKVRPAGVKEWSRVADLQALSAFVPRAEPHRAEDTAEALEPVEVEVAWKRRSEDEDDDVDMIPLIDVSLVLLVFFIMTTAAVGGAVSFIRTPPAEHRLLAIDKNMIWVGIDDPEKNHRFVYFLGQGEQGEPKKFQDKRELIRAVDDLLRGQRLVDVRIKADQHLPFEVVRDMTNELEQFKADKRVNSILAEVSEKQ
jgi:biopolymer transport protein ExbD